MNDTAIIVTQVVTLVTVIIGFLVALYREKRNRQWDLEDREHARQEQAKKQEQAKRESEERHKRIGEKLNDILRQKGIAIPPEVTELIQKLDETPKTVEEVKDKVIEINNKVDVIKEKVSDEPTTDKSSRQKRRTDG